MIVGGFLLSILPVSYFVLCLGAPAYSVFIVHFVIESIAQVIRMYLLKKLINLPIVQYIKHIYMPLILTVLISIIMPLMVHMMLDVGWLRFIVVGLTSSFSVGFSSLIIGLTKNERSFLIEKIFS